jgi:2-polyprenyl-3-methyl-5-hydroxy-6-metoxy-1,4-benzoquinol methylase
VLDLGCSQGLLARPLAEKRVRVVGVTALPFEVVFESTGRSRLVQWSAGIYHALARMWPGLFAYQVILEAEITTLDEESVAEMGRSG